MIAAFIFAVLYGQAQSIFFNTGTGSISGQVCVYQPGVENSLSCVQCAFSNAVQCANVNFFNAMSSQYVQICNQGMVNETIPQVCYYCTRTQATTCTGMMTVAENANLTRAQLQCISTNCPKTLQVFFQTGNFRVGLNPFFNTNTGINTLG